MDKKINVKRADFGEGTNFLLRHMMDKMANKILFNGSGELKREEIMRNLKRYLVIVSIALIITLVNGCGNSCLEEAYFSGQEWTEGSETLESKDTLGKVKQPLQITQVLPGEDGFLVLCKDGTVWKWDYDQRKEDAERIEGLEEVFNIIDGGGAYYALTEDGDVYVWGSNKEFQINPNGKPEEMYYEPERLGMFENIVHIDIKNGVGFAVDSTGEFYLWGIQLHGEPRRDSIPYQYKKRSLEDVDYVSAGAGNYHFFMRSDGSIFSIMEDVVIYNVGTFIFPYFDTDNPISEQKSFLDVQHENLERWYNGLNNVILYEVGTDTRVTKMTADPYTVFLYNSDGKLCYWNSQNITYHDEREFIGEKKEGKNVFQGEFVEINIREILNLKEQEPLPMIMDIICGKENSLFLCSNGEVFMSEYITFDVRDIRMYRGREEGSSELTAIKGMELKELKFRKLDWEKIVSINTDGEYRFAALDRDGECLLLDLRGF